MMETTPPELRPLAGAEHEAAAAPVTFTRSWLP